MKTQHGHVHLLGLALLVALIGVGVYFVLPFALGPGCAPPPDTVVVLKTDPYGYCLWAVGPTGARTAMGRDNHQFCAPDSASMQAHADEYNAMAQATQQDCTTTLRANAVHNAKSFWQHLISREAP